jgi:butyrate kinase
MRILFRSVLGITFYKVKKEFMSRAVKTKNNNSHRLRRVADLVEIASQMAPSSVIIAGGDRIEDLRLVDAARDRGIIERIILVARKGKVEESIEESGLNIDRGDVVTVDDDEQIAARTVEFIRSDQADIVLKGDISTPIINRYMLSLAETTTVSLASIFDAAPFANGRPMLLTDAGVTTVCNFGRMIDLIHNAIEVAQLTMGIEMPRVAILSANEKLIPSLPSTQMGLELSKLKWQDAIVCGPLSFDLATSLDSVSIKGVPDLPNAKLVAGNADILVCPGIDSANILYKTLTAMVKYGQASIAGITVGLPKPYIILSRADELETRLDSIALCSIYAQRKIARTGEKTLPAPASAGRQWTVLTVNPGSTSLKIAVFKNDKCSFEDERAYGGYGDNIESAAEQIAQLITRMLEEKGIRSLDAIAARGGFLPRPKSKLKAGTYLVAHWQGEEFIAEDQLLNALRDRPEKHHSSNIAAPIAAKLAEKFKVDAFIVDPVIVDEFEPRAEISGYNGIVRKSTAHVLSVRSAIRKTAESLHRPPEDINLVIAHLGGGITVATVKKGRIADNNIALLGEGPFTPTRAGQLPAAELIDLCYSGKFTKKALINELTKKGGLQSYLNEYRMDVIEERIAGGDEQAKQVVDAMIYKICKEIGAAFVACDCNAEAIVLTGGLVRSRLVRDGIRKSVVRLAPVMIFQENDESKALAEGVIDVLSGRIKAGRYSLQDEEMQ